MDSTCSRALRSAVLVGAPSLDGCDDAAALGVWPFDDEEREERARIDDAEEHPK